MSRRIRREGQARQSTFIAAWRKFRSLTQEELADRLDTTKATISRLENQELPYTQDSLEWIAAELGTDPASLLMRDPEDPEGIWSVWDRLDAEERQTALALLAAFLSSRRSGRAA